MPAFSISPSGPFPQNAPENFPDYLQIQDEGVNLGGPSVDTLNFTGAGVTATRGVGEQANVVTVDVPGNGGGGAAPTLVLQISGNGNAVFNRGLYSDWFGATTIASTDAHWDSDTQRLVFDTAGTYRITVKGKATGQSTWPDDLSFYGTAINGSIETQYSRTQSTTQAPAGVNFMGWCDDFVAYPAAGDSVQLAIYASNYLHPFDSVYFQADVLVQRVGDPPPP